ncbi:MAG: hypothetical protein K6D94_12225 [Clostridiales bacterium]|nr:hypothetical protein [Clostridiales bacterium]
MSFLFGIEYTFTAMDAGIGGKAADAKGRAQIAERGSQPHGAPGVPEPS